MNSCANTATAPAKNSKMKNEIAVFIKENLPDFHQRRLEALGKLNLRDVLKRKNPYLFRAKNVNTAGEIVKGILDAHLSSQEETIFGKLLENVAIYSCSLVYGGFKSGIEGIDLEFNLNSNRYIVSVKSGPNWGNSSQIKKMRDNFRKAAIILRQTGSRENVIAINGCCYGRDRKEDKGDYQKVCGEKFWTLITGDTTLYQDIIEPFGHNSKKRNDAFNVEYSKAVNRFTRDFIKDFCLADGQIDWPKIVSLVSASSLPRS